MTSNYYKACKELDICDELIEKYYLTKDYKKCFEGHLELAEKEYPLAECQVGYFYWAGLGVEKNEEKAFYWTQRAALHGDRDAEFNLAKFYEEGYSVEIDMQKAISWYKKAALQEHDIAIEKCKELEFI
jgi:TPR repeat protein